MVISRSTDNIVETVRVLDLISDHHIVACNLDVAKPPPLVKTITSRKYRSVDLPAFKNDISSSDLKTASSESNNVCDLADKYNSVMSDLLNKHAPLSTKRVVIRPKQPWFTNSLHSAKRNRRKAERKWISSRSLIDFDKFKKARNSYNIEL